MPGSVLPISPPPEMQGATAEKSSSLNRESPDNSQYESVSRQEQQRMERREAAQATARARQDQRVEDRSADQAQADKSASQVDPERVKSSQTGSSTEPARKSGSKEETIAEGTPPVQDASRDTHVADGSSSVAPDASLLEVRAIDAAGIFTFADLQALVNASEDQPLMSAQGTISGSPVQPGQTQSASALMAGMFDGTPGGKGNSVPGQGKSSAESTLKLMESLVGQLSAEAKSADPGSAIASRFPGTLELAGQSLTAAGQKPLEAAIPLRGYTTSVELPVGHAEWGNKLMGKLAWLTSQNMSVAEIHLTPPDMGPMEVRVQVQNEQATVIVHTTNSAVRDQLELHSHRLRDMLGAQGLGLESFDVSDSSARSGQDQGRDQSDEVNGQGVVNTLNDGEMRETQGALDLSWKGELDIYA